MTLENLLWIGGALFVAGIVATVLVWFGEFTEKNDDPRDDAAGKKAKYIAALIRFFIGKIKAVLQMPKGK